MNVQTLCHNVSIQFG